MNKRKKLILRFTSLTVVLVAVVVVVFTQQDGGGLSGAASLNITPATAAIQIGQKVTMSTNTILGNCAWSSSNAAIASVITTTSPKNAEALGMAAGQVTITVACGPNRLSKGTSTVTVLAPTATLSPAPTIRYPAKTTTSIGRGEILELCSDMTAIWQMDSGTEFVTLRSQGGGCAYFEGTYDGTARASVHTPGSAAATIDITVLWPLTIDPVNPTMSVGQTLELNIMAGPATWEVSDCGIPCTIEVTSVDGNKVTIHAYRTDHAMLCGTNEFGTGCTSIAIK